MSLAIEVDDITHVLLADGIAGARLVNWLDTAHLPSMERPDDFLALLADWLAWSEPPRH